jgi:hypothetical protein
MSTLPVTTGFRRSLPPETDCNGRTLRSHQSIALFFLKAVDGLCQSNGRSCPYRKLNPTGAAARIGRCIVPWETCSN